MADPDDLCVVVALARLLEEEPVAVHRVPDGYVDVFRGQRVVGSLDDDVLATFLAKASSTLATAEWLMTAALGLSGHAECPDRARSAQGGLAEEEGRTDESSYRAVFWRSGGTA
ncbi:MAG: hypothetical protein GEU98_05110 [Pseudonocardiaceae bacterium]|nr:hypothetical protein [Pseudonocardiaceae bacterium]